MEEVHTSNGDRHEAVDEQLERDIDSSDAPELAKRTLRRINKIRRYFHAEPLTDLRPGNFGDAYNCPIYNSLTDLPKDQVSISEVGGDVTFSVEEGADIDSQAFHDAINGDDVHVEVGFGQVLISTGEFSEFVSRFDQGQAVSHHKKRDNARARLSQDEYTRTNDPDEVIDLANRYGGAHINNGE